MKYIVPILLWLIWVPNTILHAENVPINQVTVNEKGQVQVEVNSSKEYYYLLFVKHKLDEEEDFVVSMTLGETGKTILTESIRAYPADHYRVERHKINDPEDIDGDGRNDMDEFRDAGRLGPLNPSDPISSMDGVVCIHDFATFQELSYQGQEVLIDEHLEDLEFVKFYILDAQTDNPKVYFMNTVTHRAHMRFARTVGIPTGGFGGGNTTGQMRGEIVYHPKVLSPNGSVGVFRFEFQPNDSYSFEEIRLGYELLAQNMTFLENNFAYYPMPNAALPKYYAEKEQYDASRMSILLEEQIYDEIDYLALNLAEGFGLLRVMELEDRPGAREVVLYESLPNEMPRVGGIITTVPQTPLSHVNLRAIQDNVPNAFIRGALEVPTIANLIGKYIYYKVDAGSYEIREATLQEVETHYARLRPTQDQTPVRDLSMTDITPLDQIRFEQSSSFGVKATNLATMRSFGFPEGTIPNGFAVPFYFYDEFMKYNGYYDAARQMMETPGFLEDYDLQDELLSAFRKTIKQGEMPDWMLTSLAKMQNSFPEGTSIRCRSSTNNEDLPGFSGAGLYDSKTQHPDEGHISKSIKQVYASLWNFRAFDERQFYRIDHFAAAMGVLCHPNFSNEKANGVGVSIDPIYNTFNTYYLNTQIGEDLVTNPEALSIPEEILLEVNPRNTEGYSIVRPSNQVERGEQIMTPIYLNQLRGYLQTIHEEFAKLYNAVGASGFAMEIEYKITKNDVLAIKQARPWSVFWEDQLPRVEITPSEENPLGIELSAYPNPFSTDLWIDFTLAEEAEINLEILDVQGRLIQTIEHKMITPGLHSYRWVLGSRIYGSGIYHLRLLATGEEQVYVFSQNILRR